MSLESDHTDLPRSLRRNGYAYIYTVTLTASCHPFSDIDVLILEQLRSCDYRVYVSDTA